MTRRYPYMPTPGSPAHKALAYFAEHQSEELSSAALAEIIGTKPAYVRSSVNESRRVDQVPDQSKRSAVMNTHAFKRFGWIKRRARRLQRFYGISRKLAIYDARMDFLSFAGVRS